MMRTTKDLRLPQKPSPEEREAQRIRREMEALGFPEGDIFDEIERIHRRGRES